MGNNKELYVLTKRMLHDQVSIGNEDTFCFKFGKYDVIKNNAYARAGTLTFIRDEIVHRSVRGETAELGVFKGDFAKHINNLFPSKKLFLFDTFEGFVSEEMQHDVEKGFLAEKNYFNTINDFTDTNVELVMAKMRHPENVVVKKGRFPETVDEDVLKVDSFAFVSLDCDLYLPILEGLRFFYPRLSDGGYIMIHDYNNIKGVKHAVYDYENEAGFVAKVPITDEAGTIVITK